MEKARGFLWQYHADMTGNFGAHHECAQTAGTALLFRFQTLMISNVEAEINNARSGRL
ncbi:hypothetical protein [uncultured Cohaesibacter sp.]|uniref:hypothetical protein n=1 Tax=uncultured Cohaesibacter sp. TaxID=1002546 RepID=UPI0029C997C8|nr:hypothetical protein [uncultured Cohaesibacter sp.]